MSKVLIIDDEEVFREDIAALLRMEGHECETAGDGESGLATARAFEPQIVLCDLVMPGMDGLEVAKRLVRTDAELAVLLVTAHATLDTAVQAFRLGAVDVVLKPVVPDALLRTVSRLAEHQDLRREVGSLRRNLALSGDNTEMIGDSPAISDVKALLERVAPHDSPVLITGESGTGKELVARAIHRANAGRKGRFLAVNCAAVSGSLFESELFGHAKGAFTGAGEDRQGYFEATRDGTLLFDEVGEISPTQQAKLLRAIESKEIVRVGESKPVPISARVLASTNRDLEAMVQENQFRADLYYRLRVVQIDLPPLRARRDDIRLLSEHFIAQFNRQMNLRCSGIEADALHALEEHDWPGNVRELRNALERALIVGDGRTIRPEDLPPDVGARAVEGGTDAEVDDLRAAARRFEAEHIGRVLRAAGGNRAEAARRLGIDVSTLWRKLADER